MAEPLEGGVLIVEASGKIVAYSRATDNTPALNDIFAEIRKYGVHVQTHVGTAPFSTPYTWAEYAGSFRISISFSLFLVFFQMRSCSRPQKSAKCSKNISLSDS